MSDKTPQERGIKMSNNTSQTGDAQAGDKDMRVGSVPKGGEASQAESVQSGSKASLRQEYLKIRDGLSADYKQRANKRIFEQLIASPEFARADTIFTYVSFRSEVDTHAIIKYALELGKRVAVPRCVPKTRLMCWHTIASLNDLHAGAYNILEPADDPASLVNPPTTSPATAALDSAASVSPAAASFDPETSISPASALFAPNIQATTGVPSTAAPDALDVQATHARVISQTSPLLEALALVPGVAFDARGGRLGYGGGYYDTFLSTFSGVSFGFCYNACFSHPPLPLEPHDVSVSRVLFA